MTLLSRTLAVASEDQVARWLVDAYPQSIADVRDGRIHWHDGTFMELGKTEDFGSSMEVTPIPMCSSVFDQFRWQYSAGIVDQTTPCGDPGRIRHEPFFKKMYGETRAAVEARLVAVRWLPKSSTKILQVTSVNGVARRLAQVSAELDELPESLKQFVLKPGGAFNWRTVEGSSQISPHAFGIAVDINASFGNYWRWDLARNGRIAYLNRIAPEVVRIFERHGFIWGGRWQHYDTLHFEYRPELLLATNDTLNAVNVLYLTRGGEAYGSERQLGHLIRELDRSRYTPCILRLDSTDTSGGCEDEAPGLSVHFPLRPWRKVVHILTRYIDALRLLQFTRSRQIRLIHCSYQWLLPYALFVGKRMGIPVIMHIRRPGNSRKKLLRLGIARCNAVIAISRRTVSELDTIPELSSRVRLIPDAVDLSCFKPTVAHDLRAELNIKNGVLVGLVARIYRNKRQLDFVRAIGDLIARGHDVHGIIAGRVDDSDYALEVEEFIARNGLASRVHLLGHREDIQHVISSLDVLVSLAGGSVMYEAMACGKLVVSAGFTRPEYSTHVINDVTGLVTESRDQSTLIAILERAVSDRELRERLGSQALDWARSNFSHHILAARTQDLYRQALFDVLPNQERPSQSPTPR